MNTNQSFEFTPRFVNAVRTKDNMVAITYEVGIPPEYLNDSTAASYRYDMENLFPQTALAASDGHSGCDSTVSACATVTLYYVAIGNHGYYQYMTGGWVKSDSTITWYNAQLQAGCNAEWYVGSGWCNDLQTRYIGVPSSGTTYNKTPTFAGSSNQVQFNDISGISAGQSITLKRGVSTWGFSFCVNHEGNNTILGCY